MKTLICVLLSWTAVLSAQYRNDLPAVMNPADPSSATAAQLCVSNHSRPQVNPQLGWQYRNMGSPRILLLLGRQLGSDLSEWQADTRDTVTTMNRAYQGPHQAKDTRDTHRMTETRKVISVNVTPGMQAFYSGFTEYLQAANIGLVSYDSIVRLAQRRNELSGMVDRSTDLREVEADAILEQVDVLVEITDAGPVSVLGKQVDRVQVNVTRLDSFETLAQHVGQGPEYCEIKQQWVAGTSGYEEQKTVILHHADVGYGLAESLLARVLTRPFQPRNQLSPVNAVQAPGKTPVKKKKRVLPPKGNG